MRRGRARSLRPSEGAGRRGGAHASHVDLLGQEVIVVLGAAVREGGEASPALRRRVFHAIELARERPDSLLLFTGGVGIFPPAEAEVMARMATRLAVHSRSSAIERPPTGSLWRDDEPFVLAAQGAPHVEET